MCGKLVKVFTRYEISATTRSREQCSSWQYSPEILFIVALFIESTGIIHRQTCTHTCFLSLYKHLRAHINFPGRSVIES